LGRSKAGNSVFETERSDRQTAETALCPPPDGLAVARSEAFYAAAVWASSIVPPSIIDSEFLERLR
jgi:hypothetical protein